MPTQYDPPDRGIGLVDWVSRTMPYEEMWSSAYRPLSVRLLPVTQISPDRPQLIVPESSRHHRPRERVLFSQGRVRPGFIQGQHWGYRDDVL